MCIKTAFGVKRTNKKSAQISTKVKSLDHLFKGGGCPEGGAIWSSSAEDEIRLLTVKMIKTLAD